MISSLSNTDADFPRTTRALARDHYLLSNLLILLDATFVVYLFVWLLSSPEDAPRPLVRQPLASNSHSLSRRAEL
jgi:hypothetical protein